MLALVWAYTAFCFFSVLPPLVKVTFDTGSYLPWGGEGKVDWWHLRGPGYPFVLILMREFSESLYSVVVVQFVVLSISVLAVSAGVYVATRRRWLALTVGALLFLNATFMHQGMQLMSEALYASLVCGYLSVILFSTRRPTIFLSILIGFMTAYAVATRATGYSLLAGLPFLWFGWRHYGRSALVTAILSCGVFLTALAAANSEVRGFWGFQKFSGPYLALHSVWFMDDDAGSPNPKLTQALLQVATKYRENYKFQRTWHDRYTYTSRSLPYFLQESTAAAGRVLGYPTLQWAQPAFLGEYAPVLAFLARRTLERHPIEFAKHVAEHYVGFWYESLFAVPQLATPWEPGLRKEYYRVNERVLSTFAKVFTTTAESQHTNRYAFRISDHQNRLAYLESIDERARAYDYVQMAIREARPWMAAGTFGISLVAIALAAWRWKRLSGDQVLFTLGIASVALHGYALNVALGSPTIPRYTVPYLSIATFLLVVGPWYYTTRMSRWMRRRRTAVRARY